MKKILFILTLSFAMTAQGQNFDKAKMDKLFDAIEQNNRGMGSISIFHDGKEIYQRSMGFADIQHGWKADKDTKYRIGSISKTYTAAIIMHMIDEGKITLETKLSDFYPDVPNATQIDVEQLLRHRSGLFNFTNATDYLDWYTKAHTKVELLEKIKASGTVFEPNTKFEYSNTNYILLAYIAEKIDGKSFAEILKTRITQPNGLFDTKYGGKINYKQGEALSYELIEDWNVQPETDMSIPSGAGALIATPADINKFFVALQTGKIVSDSSLRAMNKMVDNYGMGLFEFPFGRKRAIGHNGGIDGFQSSAGYFPEEKVSITYISNGVVFPINDVMIGALSIYFDKKYDIPDFKPSFEVTSKDLDKYLGTYSKDGFPLKITIFKKGNVLFGQATGQSSFPLEAYKEHKFKFDGAGIRLEFKPNENKMILQQGGVNIDMEKE